jgi:schlafen family protein
MNAIPASTELIGIIERNFESKELDYKGPVAWNSNDKKASCELAKDIIAMANTQGGCIVVGVSEVQSGFDLVGVTPEQAESFESTTICRFVQNYVDPPINARVQKVSHRGCLFVVIEVPRFTDTPHICQKEFPGVLRDRELYVRTDNNESAPIKSSADFRSLVETAIRNRTDDLLSSFRTILVGANLPKPTPSVEQAAPSVEQLFASQIESARLQFDNRNPLKEKGYKYFAETVFSLQEFDQYRFAPRVLELAAHKAHIEFTGWPFLFIHHNRPDCLSRTNDGLESFLHSQDFGGHDMLDFWRLNESGLFYKKELLFGAASNPPRAYVPAISRHFAEAIYCLTRLYEDLLSDSAVVSLTVTFLGTRGRALVWSDRAFSVSGYEANRPQISSQRLHTLAEWRSGLEDHAIEMTVEVLTGFHLDRPNPAELRDYIQKMFQRRF